MTASDTTPPLLARQRQELILERVRQTGGARVAEVVEILGVSEMTVRRDITELVNQGLVDRVHGGAVAVSSSAEEPFFQVKAALKAKEKQRIGTLAASRIRPRDAIIIGGGTTTLAVARAVIELPHFSTLTVLTNSLPVAMMMFEACDAARADSHPTPTVIVLGGERTRSDSLVGITTEDSLRSIRAEWAFLGAHGIDPRHGLMTPNLAEATTAATMVNAACSVVACVDSTKWDSVGLRVFCRLEDIDVIVTNEQPAPEITEIVDQHGTVIEVCSDTEEETND